MNAQLRSAFNGDHDAPPPQRQPYTDPPAFRPQALGRSIDELYADIRVACRRCGLKVLDGRHAGWESHKFEPYPKNPNSIEETQS